MRNGKQRHPTFDAERWQDGRNVAPDLGALSGEGALQRVRDPGPSMGVVRHEPGAGGEEEAGEGRSYYGLPVLKEPVWRWYIPAYFFTGGLAGACGVLGAAAQVAGGTGTEDLVRRCRLAATASIGASAALLIADLGRPARFLYMLRVFRPTSPMNMGTWIVSAFGAATGLAALPSVWPRAPRALCRAADGAGYAAGLFGLPLVGYTGVLIADTAVPVWQGTRNTLPILFAFSGAVSAGALLQLWPPRDRSGRREHEAGDMVLRFGRLAKAAEVAISFALDREAASHAPRVARPLHHGVSGAMLRAARILTAASLAADLWAPAPRPRRPRRWRSGGRRPDAGLLRGVSGALALAGTLLLRFGVMQAGRASARDPHASFEMQRRGRGGVEEAKKGEVARIPSLPGVEATGKESFHEGPGA
jgi:formate-dependent nitrite reductase membrane component NrfD